MSIASRAYAFAGVQAETAPINHKAAKPNDANDAGRRTGPFPISDRMNASIDPTNPNGTSERSGGPLLRAFLSITTSTKNPTKEARTKPLNMLLFLQSEKPRLSFQPSYPSPNQRRDWQDVSCEANQNDDEH
jgi:hypothetical protein